tara:strand:+ start:22 stop:255 length:234 start_codon:yes stop_codon:yes gene_type:complete
MVSQPIIIEFACLSTLRIKQKSLKMVNYSKYQRTRSLRVKVIDNSEQIIEKLDKILLLVILPLSIAAIINALLQVLL